MFRPLVFLFAFALAAQANAADFWWAYMASYEHQVPGSTRVNLGLKGRAPVAGYPHVIITGVTYGDKGVHGLPEPGDMDRLNALAVKVEETIAGLSPSIYTGTFTHQYQQLHYVYVKKTEGIDGALRNLYARECRGCKVYINIRHDPEWAGYLTFLYPNQPTIDANRDQLRRIGFPGAGSSSTSP